MRLLGFLLIALTAVLPAHAAATAQEREALAVEEAWSHALAINDSSAIASYSDESWVIVNADGTTTREALLKVIASHDLTHDRMAFTPDTVRIYGDVALVSGVTESSGTWKGAKFATRERSSDMFVRKDGRWRCVFTQLTPLATAAK